MSKPEPLYRKVAKPFIGCCECQWHGCPWCHEYVEIEPGDPILQAYFWTAEQIEMAKMRGAILKEELWPDIKE